MDTTTDNRYNGCRVYDFIDVNCSQLRRNSGNLIEVSRVGGDASTHNVVCAYYAGLPGGLLLSQFEAVATPETFRILKARLTYPNRNLGEA